MRGPIQLVVAGLFAAVSPLAAEVRLPALISDHMILQQGKPARVWGWAAPGEQVIVRFAGQAVPGHADPTGHWQIWLQPLPSSGQGEMIVEGSNRLVVHDVLGGEVWIGAGQSNMERALHFVTNYEEVAAHSANSQIRFFVVDHAVAAQPSEDVKGSWQIASPKSVKNVSGTAYFFAKELQAAHRVPVGIVESAFGGTTIEAWMSAETLSGNPAFHFVAEGWKQLALANTAMVVSADIGMIQDVHYPEKEPIGHRLYLAAEALAYGSRMPSSGPRLVRDIPFYWFFGIVDRFLNRFNK